MIEVTAIVVRVDADRIWVRHVSDITCGACDARRGCKSLSMSRLFGKEKSEFFVQYTPGIVSGDKVIVCIFEQALLKVSLLSYGLPLAGLMAGTILGSLINELTAVMGGVGGLLIMFGIVPMLSRKQTLPKIKAREDISVIDMGGLCRSRNL